MASILWALASVPGPWRARGARCQHLTQSLEIGRAARRTATSPFDAVSPVKQPNNEGSPSAEAVEGRTSPKGNGGKTAAAWTLPTGVLRVRLTLKSGFEPIALFTPPWQGLNLS